MDKLQTYDIIMLLLRIQLFLFAFFLPQAVNLSKASSDCMVKLIESEASVKSDTSQTDSPKKKKGKKPEIIITDTYGYMND